MDAANFEPTVATPLGAGHGWAGIAPVLGVAFVAALLAGLSARALPRERADAGRAALAVAAWGVATVGSKFAASISFAQKPTSSLPISGNVSVAVSMKSAYGTASANVVTGKRL